MVRNSMVKREPETDREFWESVKQASDIPMNISKWKTHFKRKPLTEDKENEKEAN